MIKMKYLYNYILRNGFRFYQNKTKIKPRYDKLNPLHKIESKMRNVPKTPPMKNPITAIKEPKLSNDNPVMAWPMHIRWHISNQIQYIIHQRHS